MRISVFRVLLAAALLCAIAVVCAGCDSYEPQSSESEATSYYQEKYQSQASVKESAYLGN